MRLTELETCEQSSNKVYVPVSVIFDAYGKMTPVSFVWTDGTMYTIDRCASIMRASTTKAGGNGDRYEIYIKGKQTYLFYEHDTKLTAITPGRWFLERK